MGQQLDIEAWQAACELAGLAPSPGLLDAAFTAGLAVPSPSGASLAHRLLAESLVRNTKTGNRLQRRTLCCFQALMALGRERLRAGDHRTAQTQFGRARAMALRAEDHASAAVAATTIGESQRQYGQLDEARKSLEAALEAHRQLGARRHEAETLLCLGAVRRQLREPNVAIERLREAYRIFEALGDPLGRARALSRMAATNIALEELDLAGEQFEASLALQAGEPDPKEAGLTVGNYANFLTGRGRWDSAAVRYEEALVLLRAAGDLRIEGALRTNFGWLEVLRGRQEHALALLEAALSIQREIGDRWFEGITLTNLGTQRMIGSEPRLAAAHLESALAIHRETGNLHFYRLSSLNLAELHVAAGRLDAARDLLEFGLSELEPDEWRTHSDMFGWLCEVEARAGNFEKADACLKRAQDALDGRDTVGAERAMLHTHAGHLAHCLGDSEAALAELAAARATAEDIAVSEHAPVAAAIGRLAGTLGGVSDQREG